MFMVKKKSLKVLVVDKVVIKHCEELLLAVLCNNVLQKLERIPVVIPGAVPDLLVPCVTWAHAHVVDNSLFNKMYGA